MKRAGRVVLAVLLGLSLGAAPRGKDAAPRSPRFRRAARVLFADDFSDGTLKRWRVDGAGAWSVRHGVLCGNLPDTKQARAFVFAGDPGWTDYAVDVDVCGTRGADKGIALRVRGKKGLGVDLRSAHYQDVVLYVGELPAGSGKAANQNGTWHHLRAEVRGSSCRVSVDGRIVVDGPLVVAPPRSGGIALSAYTGGVGQCTVYYDNVVVTPLAASDP